MSINVDFDSYIKQLCHDCCAVRGEWVYAKPEHCVCVCHKEIKKAVLSLVVERLRKMKKPPREADIYGDSYNVLAARDNEYIDDVLSLIAKLQERGEDES